MRTQILITCEARRRLPSLYSTSDATDPVVCIKLFTPYSSWTWLLTEYNPDTGVAFGYAYNAQYPDGAELGYMNVRDMQALRTSQGWQAIERDAYWHPMPLSEAKRMECPQARR